MHAITKEKLLINARNSWRMWSNWVMTASGIGAAAFVSVPPDQQQAFLAHLPVPAWTVPVLAAVVGIAARLWPQHSISPAVAAAKSEDAPQPDDSSRTSALQHSDAIGQSIQRAMARNDGSSAERQE